MAGWNRRGESEAGPRLAGGGTGAPAASWPSSAFAGFGDGQVELDEILAQREKINQQLQSILDKQTDPWGVKVSNVEIKHIDLPQEMQRAMAKQAEAERERRSKVISAEGEYQAATRLAEAAGIIEQHPMALQLRYLQTLQVVAAENNSTTLFPIPIDLLEAFMQKVSGTTSGKKAIKD